MSLLIRRVLPFAIAALLFGAPAFAFADTELLTANPSFAGGSSAGWTPASDITGVTPTITSAAGAGHTDNFAADIKVVTYSPAGTDAKWTTTAAVQTGKEYNLSDWYKSSTTTSMFIYYTGKCEDGISDASAGCWVGDAAPASAWTQFHSNTFTVPAGVTSITIGHTIAGVGELTTDDYSLLEGAAAQFTRGLVTLTFDDGLQSFSDNATSTLNANGLKATEYVITGADGSNLKNLDSLGTSAGYMSPQEVVDLFNSGYDIGVHTENHYDLAKDNPTKDAVDPEANPQTFYTDRNSLYQGELNKSLDNLKALLPAAPLDSFAYPFGSYCAPVLGDCTSATVQDPSTTANVLTPVKALFKAARSVDEGFNFASDLQSDNIYKLKMEHVTNVTTADTINGWIDSAVANHEWLILMFHEVRAGANDATVNYPTGQSTGLCLDPSNPGQPDLDCTSRDVLDAVATHLKTVETTNPGTVLTMHQVITDPTLIPPAVPTIAVHADVVAEATSTLGAYVAYTLPAVTPTGTVTCTPPASTTLFAMGSTTVTCSATGATNTTFSVIVKDTTKPVVTLTGSSTMQLIVGTPYTELGATATDNLTGTTSLPVTITGAVGTTTIGSYVLTYAATDTAGNVGSTTRTVNVVAAPDTTAPVVTLIGSATVSLNLNDVYTEQGATSTDNVDTNLPISIFLDGSATSTTVASTTIDTSVAGTHTIVYKATDTAGNVGSATRTVNVATPAAAPVSTGGGGGGGGGGFSYYGSLQINSGAATSTSRTVSLSLNSNAGQVWVSNDSSFTTGGFVPLTSNMVWPLSLGSGLKTVYVHFGVSSSTVSNAQASIYLNDGTPLAPVTSIGGSVLGAQTSATCYTFTKSLSVGTANADVTALQNTLTTLGYYSGPITGYFGAMTSAGVSKFQAAKGISQTGTVGPLTRAALNSCTTGAPAPTTGGTVLGTSTVSTTGYQFNVNLGLGSSGADVTALQNKLTVEGVYSGPITGTFGPLTLAGVKAYQSKYGLPSTGYVGPLTRAQLNK